MVVFARLGVAFQVGVLVLAAGAAIAACGSIEVINAEADGGGTGTGGIIAGGTGGGHGGAAGGGGRIGNDGGALGGIGGGPIGGSNGGGAGGSNRGSGGTLGGLGGLFGGIGGRSGGAGGSPGIGGFIGGGLGGFTGGGIGGRGGTSQTCLDIQRNFTSALAEAKMCTNNGQCQLITNDRLECGCPTSVTRTDKLDSYRTSWNQSGCSSGISCGIAPCTYVSGGICTTVTGGGTICVDQSAGGV